MNNLISQAVPSGAQSVQSPGIERKESSHAQETSGKQLPPVSVTQSAKADELSPSKLGNAIDISIGSQRDSARPVRVSNQAVERETGDDAGAGKDRLEKAVAQLNDYIQSVQRDLRFSLDEGSGRSVISVVDSRSSEVIRQIPLEVTLTLAQKLNNDEPLLLFSAQV